MSEKGWTATGAHESPSTGVRVDRWLELAAVSGTGSLLLGPHARGAQAVVPPAVVAHTAKGNDVPFCDEGWRLAVWEFGPDDDGLIDASRPVSMERADVPALVALVRAEASEKEEWLRHQVRLRLTCLGLLLRHASLGAEPLLELRAELDELLLDATCAFGAAWVERCKETWLGE